MKMAENGIVVGSGWDWHARYVKALAELSEMPSHAFTVGELGWIQNEIYGRPRFRSNDRGVRAAEDIEKFLAEAKGRLCK